MKIKLLSTATCRRNIADSHECMTEDAARTHASGTEVPTKWPHGVYRLHIHNSLDGVFCTQSWGSSLRANNKETCRIFVADSHYCLTDGIVLSRWPLPI